MSPGSRINQSTVQQKWQVLTEKSSLCGHFSLRGFKKALTMFLASYTWMVFIELPCKCLYSLFSVDSHAFFTIQKDQQMCLPERGEVTFLSPLNNIVHRKRDVYTSHLQALCTKKEAMKTFKGERPLGWVKNICKSRSSTSTAFLLSYDPISLSWQNWPDF